MKIVTFGEIMLRLSPPGFERFFQSPVLQATFGGAEANVAVSLAHFGLDSYYVTRLPAHAVGEAALGVLRAEGVRTDFVLRGGERLGIYFAEAGASQRASTVIYDRARSAVAEIAPGAIDWRAVLDGAAWLHVTGITAALGEAAASSVREAIETAKQAGARVSIDLNFRRKLWSEAQAQAVMRPIVRCADVLIANEEDMQASLGIAVPGADVTGARLDLAGYREAAERIGRELGPPLVAITLRESLSASDNGWSGALWDGRAAAFHTAPRYDVRIVDRIGAGDAFAAGLIYALATGRPPEAALRFAVAAGVLKHSIPGDFNRVSVAEIDRLAKGEASGRVVR